MEDHPIKLLVLVILAVISLVQLSRKKSENRAELDLEIKKAILEGRVAQRDRRSEQERAEDLGEWLSGTDPPHSGQE